MAANERAVAFLRGHRGWTALLIGAGLLVVAGAALVASPGASVPHDSGVAGRVWLGPLSPVQRVGGPPNERPYAATLEVLRPDARIVATVRSGQGGFFRVNLAAGAYVLQGMSGSGDLPHAIPVPVVVMAHRFATVRVEFDTGIR